MHIINTCNSHASDMINYLYERMNEKRHMCGCISVYTSCVLHEFTFLIDSLSHVLVECGSNIDICNDVYIRASAVEWCEYIPRTILVVMDIWRDMNSNGKLRNLTIWLTWKWTCHKGGFTMNTICYTHYHVNPRLIPTIHLIYSLMSTRCLDAVNELFVTQVITRIFPVSRK